MQRLDELTAGTVEGHFQVVDDDPIPLRATATYDFGGASPGMKLTRLELHFEGEHVGSIDPTMLRALPLKQFQQDVWERLQEDYPTHSLPFEDGLVPENIRNQWPKGDLQPIKLYVQKIYNDAVARQAPATMAVAECFGVSRATASRMIARTRADGITLSEPVPYPGKVKGNGAESARSR